MTNHNDIVVVTTSLNAMQRGVDRQRIVHALYERFTGGIKFMDLYRALNKPSHFKNDIDALVSEGRILRIHREQPDGTWALEYSIAN